MEAKLYKILEDWTYRERRKYNIPIENITLKVPFIISYKLQEEIAFNFNPSLDYPIKNQNMEAGNFSINIGGTTIHIESRQQNGPTDSFMEAIYSQLI